MFAPKASKWEKKLITRISQLKATEDDIEVYTHEKHLFWREINTGNNRGNQNQDCEVKKITSLLGMIFTVQNRNMHLILIEEKK